MKKLLLILLLLPFFAFSQSEKRYKSIIIDSVKALNGGSVDFKDTSRFEKMVSIGGLLDTTAILTLTNTTKGLLIPRMTTAQRDLIGSPATGLLIYNTTTNQVEFFETTWKTIAEGTFVKIAGDIMTGILSMDGVAIETDIINEFNADAGITVDGVLIKDTEIKLADDKYVILSSDGTQSIGYNSNVGGILIRHSGVEFFSFAGDFEISSNAANDGSGTYSPHISFKDATGIIIEAKDATIQEINLNAPDGIGFTASTSHSRFVVMKTDNLTVGERIIQFPDASGTFSLIESAETFSGIKTFSADLNISDGKNIILDATTGTKIGTTTSQKLGLWNATPIAQQAQIVDLKDALVNFGFYATSLTQTPLNLDGGTLSAGTVNGGTTAGAGFTLESTSDATKGKIFFGTGAYDETTDRLGIGIVSPSEKLEVNGNAIINGTLSTTAKLLTLGSSVTTFSVTSNVMTMTGDAGANTIATITGANSGQYLILIFVDGLVTLTDDNGHGANTLDLSAAFTSADDTTIHLIYNGTSWFEISRSVN